MTVGQTILPQPHKHPARRTVQPAQIGAALPPLESGDRLTRTEFERRYDAMPRLKKAELIEGVVFMPSPIRNRHSEAHAHVMVWLGTYCAATSGTYLNDNATIRLDQDNVVQPDALLRLDETAGGQSRISEDDYIEGAPELIAEIAASSASYDLHDKKNVYRRNGVQEYLVWRVYDEALDWFRWQEGRYVLLEPDDEGVVHSQVFPGLRLDMVALLKGDLARVLAVAQQGLETGTRQVEEKANT
jgi:Uma2 family endonuclease